MKNHEFLKDLSHLQKVLERNSFATDLNAEFPLTAINELKKTGYMGLAVPEKYGGMGLNIRELADIAQVMGNSCLSTAMIWAMHCQQVAVIANSAASSFKSNYLSQTAKGLLIASVTSDDTTGGSILRTDAPLREDQDNYKINRVAPIVTGGAYADAFLITMSEGVNSSNIKLVFLEKSQANITIDREWNTLGMRGTCSVSLKIDGLVSNDNIVNTTIPFNKLAMGYMIPYAHILWSACWLGATKRAYEEAIRILRSSKMRFKLKSDLILDKISRVRMNIDAVEFMLNQVADNYLELLVQSNSDGIDVFSSSRFNIHLNNLKVFASETLTNSVKEMINIVGLNDSYRVGEQNKIERIYRDLLSAPLMYHNNRLTLASANISLFDSKLLPDI